jgi:hypothetical protein
MTENNFQQTNKQYIDTEAYLNTKGYAVAPCSESSGEITSLYLQDSMTRSDLIISDIKSLLGEEYKVYRLPNLGNIYIELKK